jgi:hypothetical protein
VWGIKGNAKKRRQGTTRRLTLFIMFLSWVCVDILGHRSARISPSGLDFE